MAAMTWRCLRCGERSAKAEWKITADKDTGVPDVRQDDPKCVLCGGRVVQE